ncbi:MAG: hypothetical protein MUE92_06105 [Chloroflexi bacterium]|jgi:hypothetical protein|nr:hypothetical protein [Chloroflexota bacterium]
MTDERAGVTAAAPATPADPPPTPAPATPAAPATASALADLVSAAPPADPATAAALADLIAARAALGDELIRLEASARAAVDVRAKVKRNPGKTAAVVGGTAFVVAGGPRRVFRSVRRRVFGAPDPLPPSLLPDQVEKAVRALGDDGAKVRGSLEREFAAFVDTNRKGESRFIRRVLLTAGVPLAIEASRMLLKRLFEGSAEDVAAREEAIRARIEGKGTPPTR